MYISISISISIYIYIWRRLRQDKFRRSFHFKTSVGFFQVASVISHVHRGPFLGHCYVVAGNNTPPKTNMTMEKTSSNGGFSIVMLVFGGVFNKTIAFFSGWWFKICFIFTPILGEMI